MSRICEVCGKSSQVGNFRSHALNSTKRRFQPNLQRVRIESDKGPRRIRICTSCLKANKVKKAL